MSYDGHMIDFPIAALLDERHGTRWLAHHLHPQRLTCPLCGHSERRLFRAQGQSPVYRCRACAGNSTLLTGTVFGTDAAMTGDAGAAAWGGQARAHGTPRTRAGAVTATTPSLATADSSPPDRHRAARRDDRHRR
jgi:hypothetical protein